MKFETVSGVKEITRHQLAETQKRIKTDLKYMARHGVEIDMDYIKAMSTREMVAHIWNLPELAHLNDHDRERAVSSMIVFPQGHSRKQAQLQVAAAARIGVPMTFAQVLRGELDTHIEADAEALYAQGHNSGYVKLYVGQKYFGSQ